MMQAETIDEGAGEDPAKPKTLEGLTARIAGLVSPPTGKGGGQDDEAGWGAALSMGERAALRRLDPAHPGGRWMDLARVLALADIETLDRSGEEGGADATRWALVVHCLALANGRHVPPYVCSCGSGLFAANVSEKRVASLLAADADVLMDLLPRTARRLAAEGVACDWSPLVRLTMSADRTPRGGAPHRPSDHPAERARRQIAREFVRAQHRQKTEESAT